MMCQIVWVKPLCLCFIVFPHSSGTVYQLVQASCEQTNILGVSSSFTLPPTCSKANSSMLLRCFDGGRSVHTKIRRTEMALGTTKTMQLSRSTLVQFGTKRVLSFKMLRHFLPGKKGLNINGSLGSLIHILSSGTCSAQIPLLASVNIFWNGREHLQQALRMGHIASLCGELNLSSTSPSAVSCAVKGTRSADLNM